jgi:hypothetical protein
MFFPSIPSWFGARKKKRKISTTTINLILPTNQRRLHARERYICMSDDGWRPHFYSFFLVCRFCSKCKKETSKVSPLKIPFGFCLFIFSSLFFLFYFPFVCFLLLLIHFNPSRT